MAIEGYLIGGYWCLLLVIILMTISGYSIMAISSYFIDGYWLLFY
jgi:hypothetical protein